MITRRFTFKFYNPNEKYDIPHYGILIINFCEDLDIITDTDIDNILRKVSENIKNQIRDKYAKDNGYNTKTSSFFCRKDYDIKMFDFKRRPYSPFKDDQRVYSIIREVNIDKAFPGYCDSLDVE